MGSTEAEEFTEDPAYGYAKFKSMEKGESGCFFNLLSFNKGTLGLELSIFIAQEKQGREVMSEQIQTFTDQLDAKIAQMQHNYEQNLGEYGE